MSERRISRSELRKNLKAFLDSVPTEGPLFIGKSVVVLEANEYLSFAKRISSLEETLEIMSNKKLLNQILEVAGTLEEETRLGHLHSFEEVFGGSGRS